MKNILLVGYYDDYARFYSEVCESINKKNKDVNCINWYFNLSGYLYGICHGTNSEWINQKAILNSANMSVENSVLSEDYFKTLIEYNERCEDLSIQKRNEFYKLASKYIIYFRNEIEKINPQMIVLPGDCRLAEKIIVDIAKDLNIKVMYFEQGPYGTTIIDYNGVNSFCSFRHNSPLELNDDSVSFKKPIVKEKYKRFPLYRGLDKIYALFASNRSFFPFDNKEYAFGKSIDNKLSKKLKDKLISDKYVILILQVPHDANFTHHNPHFKSHYDIVKSVYDNLPAGYDLVVREHPLYKSKYEVVLYDFIDQNMNIALDGITSIDNAIANAEFVIVNNSTSGLDALAKYKRVVVLGDSYYDKSNCFFKIESKNELKEKLLLASESVLDKSLANNYLNNLVYSDLILGHFRDKDLAASPIVADKILSNLK